MKRAILVLLVVAAAVGALYPKYVGDRRYHFRQDMDLAGGVRLFYRVPAETRETNTEAELDNDLEECRRGLETRMQKFHGYEPKVIKMGREGILVEVPGTRNIASVLLAIGKAGVVNMRGVKELSTDSTPRHTIPYQARDFDDVTIWCEFDERIDLASDLEFAAMEVQHGPESSWGVTLPLTSSGASKVAKLAEKYFERTVAVLVDDEIVSLALLQTHGAQSLILTGFKSKEEAEARQKILSSGTLPLSLNLDEQQSVDPLFGKALRQSAVRSLFAGVGLLVVFLLLVYLDRWRFLFVLFATGVFALALFITATNLDSTFNLGLIIWSLTGIAGISLFIGMNVDSQVLMFEEIIQQYDTEAKFEKGVRLSFSDALKIVLLGDFTTALALSGLLLSEGELRHYFILTGLGVAINSICFLFAHCLLSDPFVKEFSWFRTWEISPTLHRRLEKLPAYVRRVLAALPRKNGLGPDSHFGWLPFTFPLVALLLIGLYGLPWGIEFKGGTELKLLFATPPDEGRLTTVANSFFTDTCEIHHIKDQPEYVVRTRVDISEIRATEFVTLLGTNLGQGAKLLHSRSFGNWRAPRNYEQFIYSTLAAFGFMLILFFYNYAGEAGIAFRILFAIVCDIAAVIIFLYVFSIPMSIPVLAAIVTLIGYGVNDSVVIAEKIKRHVMKHGNSLPEVGLGVSLTGPAARAIAAENLRNAMRRIMSRIAITLTATMCPLLGMLLMGQGVIRDYAIVMLVGLLAGAISSYFIVGCWSVALGAKWRYA